MSTPKFKKGDMVICSVEILGSPPGSILEVVEPNVDYYNGNRYVKVSMREGELEGNRATTFESKLTYASPYSINSFTFTRDRLNLWRKVLRGEQGLDEPDAEELATELDTLLDPPITREYTITATGKAADIEDAILQLEGSEKVLRDDVKLSIEMKSEKSAT